MRNRPTLDQVVDALVNQGARIIETPGLPTKWWGACSRKMGVVYLRKGLTDTQALPVLLHEFEHWQRWDEGHQTLQVENRIWEKVASQLIDSELYAKAERLYGPNPVGIANELDVTLPVVEAWQRWKSKAAECARIGGQSR